MRLNKNAPGVLTARAGAFETFALDGNTGGFVSDSTRRPRARQEILCHRCRQPRARRGAISAAVVTSDGYSVRRYLCGRCCVELGEG